jgi:hypothetical protein
MAIINSYPTVTPENGDLLLLVDTSVEGNPTKTATVSSVSSLVNKGYKDYVFIFTQKDNNNPVVTELNNDTGLTFTFTRFSTGQFHLVPSDSLDVSKTWAQVTGGNVGEYTILNIKNYEANLIAIINLESTTGIPRDDVDTGFVEIRIYS